VNFRCLIQEKGFTDINALILLYIFYVYSLTFLAIYSINSLTLLATYSISALTFFEVKLQTY
jgi:hypothetical protein